MGDMSTGLSALMAARHALLVAGHNIANVNTPGYTRQRAHLVTNQPMLRPVGYIGSGVTVVDILGVRDRLLDARVVGQTSALASATVMSTMTARTEGVFDGAGEGNLQDAMNAFFAAVNDLATAPEDGVMRQLLVTAGTSLADKVRSLSARLDELGEYVKDEVDLKVQKANSLIDEIAKFNLDIQKMSAQNATPNDLIDRRDEAVRQLAELIDINVLPRDSGKITVVHNGHTLVMDGATSHLAASLDLHSDRYVLQLSSNGADVGASGGSIGGLLHLRNDWLPEQVAQFEELVQALIREVNAVHATGVGPMGPWGTWDAANSVTDADGDGDPTNDLLARAGLAFPPASGSVWFNITDLSTGQVEQVELAVDPEVDSLSSIAAKINAMPHLSAAIRAGRLSLYAEDGYGFDCSGGLDAHPDDLGSVGIALSGSYTGDADDRYTLRALGSGTVGTTPGLQVQVLDASGGVVATLDVGDAYVPGERVEIGNGVSVAFDAGDIVAGEETGFAVIADSDTAGLLPALGLNAFFVGTGKDDIRVRGELAADPSKIASGKSAQPGDNANLLKLLELQDARVVGDHAASLNGAFQAIIGQIGIDVDRNATLEQNQSLLMTTMQNQRDSVSGVSLDEEVTHLVQYQQAYEAAARYMSTIKQMLQVILDM